ncbi:hypothetical protein FF38_13134 [Lucilia cuprina]|uniref:Uncharacterized protein n=1 Tax=Lucilia cuprina TaxID=7375 RepID=A0A0L0CPH3_LUCCU|nr:hypothetical protein FF38_13134 [Lucilia cuprina]
MSLKAYSGGTVHSSKEDYVPNFNKLSSTLRPVACTQALHGHTDKQADGQRDIAKSTQKAQKHDKIKKNTKQESLFDRNNLHGKSNEEGMRAFNEHHTLATLSSNTPLFNGKSRRTVDVKELSEQIHGIQKSSKSTSTSEVRKSTKGAILFNFMFLSSIL